MCWCGQRAVGHRVGQGQTARQPTTSGQDSPWPTAAGAATNVAVSPSFVARLAGGSCPAFPLQLMISASRAVCMCGSTQGSGQLYTTAAGSTKQALFQRFFTPLQENPASCVLAAGHSEAAAATCSTQRRPLCSCSVSGDCRSTQHTHSYLVLSPMRCSRHFSCRTW